MREDLSTTGTDPARIPPDGHRRVRGPLPAPRGPGAELGPGAGDAIRPAVDR